MVKDDENIQSKTSKIVLKPESSKKKTKTKTKTVSIEKPSSSGLKFNKFREKIKNLKKQITLNEEDNKNKNQPKEQPTKSKTKKKKKKKKKQTSEFFQSIQEEGIGLKKDKDQDQEPKKKMEEIDLKDNQKQPEQKETKSSEGTKDQKEPKKSKKSKAKKTSETKEKNQKGSLIKKPKFLRREKKKTKKKQKKELVNRTLENKRKEYNFVLKSIDSDFKTMKKKESGQLNFQLSSISSSVHKSLNVAQDVMRHIENSNTQIEDLIQTINTLSSDLQIVPINTVK